MLHKLANMFGRKKQHGATRIRTVSEDILKGVANRGDLEAVWTPDSLVRRDKTLMEQGLALELLENEAYIERAKGGWQLTQKGHDRAIELLRAHRLVETYLARKEGLAADELHSAAEKAEHELSTEKINRLADKMNRPRYDPHGDPIPERAHDLRVMDLTPLLEMDPGTVGRIAHIEDEPREDFRELLDKGIALELPLRMLDREGNEVRIELAGEELTLSSRLAALVEIIPEADPDWYPQGVNRLSQLRPGDAGIVEYISSACMGPERRRLLDFGVVPGSEIRCEFSSPFGSPVAYSLRGTTIGLRRSQAQQIFVRRKE